jgi:hypothetical protein
MAVLTLPLSCTPQAGGEGGPCYGNDTCDFELVCDEGVCLKDLGEEEGTTEDAGPDEFPENGSGSWDAGPLEGCTASGVELDTPTELPQTPSGDPPSRECVEAPPTVAAGSNVTVEGCIDIFGIGNRAKVGLKVAFFAIDQDPSVDTPDFGEAEVALETQDGPFQSRAQECTYGGFFQLADVPTHTPFIVKTWDESEQSSRAALNTYDYRVFFHAADVTDGVYDFEPRFVYKSTYESLPTLAGKRIEGMELLADGVGRGLILGTIHDCGDELVEGAIVSSDQMDGQTKVFYSDADPDDPTPDPTRGSQVIGTNSDGLFGIVNASTASGTDAHQIAAVVRFGAEGGCGLMGEATVRAFPDSVTYFSNRGGALPIVEAN